MDCPDRKGFAVALLNSVLAGAFSEKYARQNLCFVILGIVADQPVIVLANHKLGAGLDFAGNLYIFRHFSVQGQR